MYLMIISNVMAASTDGQISSRPGENESDRRKYGFVNDADKEWVMSHLSHADAVITGAETLRAAGRIWAVENHHRIYPPWVILTNRGLDAGLPFWRQNDIQKILVSRNPLGDEFMNRGENVRNEAYGEWTPAFFTHDLLRKMGCERVLLFGGGEVNRLFYQEGLVDELHLTLCPVIVGSATGSQFVNRGLPGPVSLSLASSQVSGNHVFLSYMVEK